MNTENQSSNNGSHDWRAVLDAVEARCNPELADAVVALLATIESAMALPGKLREQAAADRASGNVVRFVFADERDKLATELEAIFGPAPPATDAPDRMAIRLLVAAGFVTEAKANEALQIAHGFASGPLTPATHAPPAADGVEPVATIKRIAAQLAVDDREGDAADLLDALHALTSPPAGGGDADALRLAAELDSAVYGANAAIRPLLADASALIRRLASGGGADATMRVLAALGHVPKVDDSCTAHVVLPPPENRKPGPSPTPVWCCLKAGHEGPHRCNNGGMSFSYPFRENDEVEFREPITRCEKCGQKWPCQDAQKALAESAGGARVGQEWQPIETAPKDGTLVLTFAPLRTPFTRNIDLNWFSDGAWRRSNYQCLPTHWMPIPAAPSPETPR